jgi:hypothetical protein
MDDFTSEQRRKAAGLADRLIYGDDATFYAEDAEALRAMLPSPGFLSRLAASLPIPLEGSFRIRSKARPAVTTPEFNLRGERVFRAGQWLLTHETGGLTTLFTRSSCVRIIHVMSREGDELDAQIVFRGSRPLYMARTAAREFRLGRYVVEMWTPTRWKEPVWGQLPTAEPHA